MSIIRNYRFEDRFPFPDRNNRLLEFVNGRSGEIYIHNETSSSEILDSQVCQGRH